MADERFFKEPAPMTLADIARVSGAELSDDAQADVVFHDVAALDQAGAEHVSFFDNARYKEQFLKTKAGACFVSPAMAAEIPAHTQALVSKNPYKAYALTAQAFYPQELPTGEISARAFVHDTAMISAGVSIEHGAVIAEGVVIGEGVHIGANAVIGKGVNIGAHTRIGANATVSHAMIGSHSRVYTGARIGQDGFGFAIDPQGHVKVPQLGRVIIGDHVEIGANTTIDRGAGPDTVIGDGAWIDNLVQIGHNVKIGRGCVIVAQVGISGSTVIEDYAVLAGQVGVAGHLKIGKGARIAAQSGIMRDVPAGEEQMGYPAMPIKQFMRTVAALNRLIKKGKSV